MESNKFEQAEKAALLIYNSSTPMDKIEGFLEGYTQAIEDTKQYAEQEAIAFAGWERNNAYYEPQGWVYMTPDKVDIRKTVKHLTTSELYTIFKTTKPTKDNEK